MRPGIQLRPTSGRDVEVAALARLGERVGLRGVLDDLDRTARAVRVPAPAASWGFRWDRQDALSRRWWPQGVTTSADAATADGRLPSGLDPGRSLVVTSAYSKVVDDVSHGARLTFVDVSDARRLRYRHVLLVEPVLRDDGGVDVRPIRLHAGGIVWHGGHLHVTATRRGLSSFRLDDVVRLPAKAAAGAFGYRYVLPSWSDYTAAADPGVPPMRYSFASLDRTGSTYAVVAGEYATAGEPRLLRYALDPSTSLPSPDADGVCRPVSVQRGPLRMQGAVAVDGTWYVTSSRGRFRRGSLWTGPSQPAPGTATALVQHPRRLPVGPEDLAYDPEHDLLWSVSEHRSARYVYAMPRQRAAG